MFTIVRVPFSSKKYLTQNGKYNIQGTAYYIFDENMNNIRQLSKINSGTEIRPNDISMKKPTYFYKSKGKYRKNIFRHSETNKEVVLASKDEINNLNEYTLKYETTIKNTEGMITGSNTSGCESNHRVCPYLINDLQNKKMPYNFLRFENAFNRMKIPKRMKVTNYVVNSWEELESESISISEFLKENTKFLNVFYFYNNDLIDEDQFKELVLSQETVKKVKESHNYILDDNNYIDQLKVSKNELISKDIRKELKEKIMYYSESANISVRRIDSGSSTTKLESSRLRNIFSTKLKIYSKLNNIQIDFLNEGIPIQDCEAAHLVAVKDLKLEPTVENILSISDENNGILVSPTIHTLMDKGKLSFDKNGNTIIRNLNININVLDKKVLTPKRIKYIKKRNKKYNY